jgi:L-ornithine N5-oxygenase
VLDVVGIGFGPSNLGLAIAIDEHNRRADAAAPVTAQFVERQPRFGWHRGMLIDDATMQVSFLKDLVTLRNPASEFSFVSYLHSRGRLVDFINHKILFPLRVEFHDYLEWAAARFEHLVSYDEEATDVEPVVEDGTVVAFDIVSGDGAGPGIAGRGLTVRRARNVVVATGLAPSLPPGVDLGPRIWHNLDVLDRVQSLPDTPAPRRFVVVGAGQSAAEVVEFLHRRFPTAEVCSVFARWGYTPSDDTPYANRIFDPDAVDVYFGADDAVKRMLFDYHRNTNYSVVDQDLINELYRREYQERVQGTRRLRMLNASRVVDVRPGDGTVGVDVEFLPTGERTTLAADAVVYATGYQPTDALRLLGGAGDLAVRRADGAPLVARDYRLELTVPSRAGIYLQGGTEHAHGITSTLLSNIAIRSGEIVDSIVRGPDAAADPADADAAADPQVDQLAEAVSAP